MEVANEQPRDGAVDPSRLLEFAQYLRENAQLPSAEALSGQFGLPLVVVREALQVHRGLPDPTEKLTRRRTWNFERVKAVFSRRPLLFIFLSAVVVSLPAVFGLPAKDFGVLYLTGVLLQAGIVIAASFFQARMRFGVLASIVTVAPHLSILEGMTVVYRGGLTAASWPTFLAYTALGILVFSVILCVATISASLLGAMMKMRRELLEEQRLDRLKLLEQVVHLQDRLESSSGPVEVGLSIRDRLAWARGHWYLVAIGAGLVMFANAGTIMITIGFPDPNLTTPPTILQLLVSSLWLAIELGLFLFVGFVSGSFLRGLAAGAIVILLSNTIWLLPLPGGGIERMMDSWSRMPFTPIYIGTTILICSITGMAAAVEERTYRKARIEAADQAALLAEMVRLQQILSRGAAKVCVMAIDTVGSTQMKRGEDALRVELSFRSFQDLIDRVVRAHSGRVFSTAGDGALAEFPEVEQAFVAARELLSRLAEFNERVNRLRSPFQVRMGLHFGEVHGDLQRAEFTQVIDVAAHVESVAPPGGIAITAPAAEQLSGVHLSLREQSVDGFPISVWTG